MDPNQQLIGDFNENQIFLTENEFPFADNGFSFATEAMDATAVDDTQRQETTEQTTAITTETTPLTTPTTASTSIELPIDAHMTSEDALAVLVKTEPDEEAPPEEPVSEFTVEAIVGKRKRNNRVEYCVKWHGFDDTDNTWEPIDNLNCNELIAEFEQNKTTPTTARQRAQRQRKTTPATPTTTTTTSAKKGDGFARGLKPKKVVGVTQEAGQLYYSVEWVGQKEAELVASKVARVKCPQLVIQFLQSKLRFNRKRPKEPLENYRPLASKKFSLFSQANE